MEKLTTQDIIDFAAKLYDEKGYNRNDIWLVLNALRAGGAKFDFHRVFDLVVG